MKAPRPLVRSLTTFFEGPATVRNAMRVIVAATAAATVLGGFLVWLVDRRDFPTPGDGLWWALQTVTTVGYGDITPKNWVGRVIGAAVLLYAVAFLSVLTAAITTSFIQRARHQRRGAEAFTDPVLERLDEIASRLDRLEQELGDRNDTRR